MTPPALRPAVFLDRDGTLIHDSGYCADPALVRPFPGTVHGLLALHEGGYALVVITNQSGIGRGWITPDAYEAVHRRFLECMAPAPITATYMCPDAPDVPSAERKPSPAMVLRAAREHGLDLARSWFIGDKEIDVQCGLNAGVRSILVRTGEGSKARGEAAAFVADDIHDAARFILKPNDV
jgi:D-glycero-D-manno-heptose 1,7-bisphosphate phosphatase